MGVAFFDVDLEELLCDECFLAEDEVVSESVCTEAGVLVVAAAAAVAFLARFLRAAAKLDVLCCTDEVAALACGGGLGCGLAPVPFEDK